MDIIGISAFYHDSAAALVRDGKVIAAAQEERFTRKKHDAGFPRHAVAYCLREGGIRLADLEHVVFYEKPFLKFERLLETYMAFAPRGFGSFRLAVPVWVREKLFQKKLLAQALEALEPGFDATERLLFTEHHLSHAASAFYPSPFEQAAVLTLDGVGEWATTTLSVGQGNRLTLCKELHFPHSLGLLYSAFTYYLGFKVNSGEYKVMGLAPYGESRYAQTIFEHLIDVKPDGSFRLNQEYFDYCVGLQMTNPRFNALFGGHQRRPESPLEQVHMDLAASIQAVINTVLLQMTRAAARETGMPNLCLAGGVALNCVANGKILRDGAFQRLWIQPAAGDAGGALGAALMAYYCYSDQPRRADGESDGLEGSYLGPAFTQEDIERRLQHAGAQYTVLDEDAFFEACVQALTDEKVLGWFQGRMEFGPRALGARSILGDPRSPRMQSVLNLKIKYRESFRPFAPSVLREDASAWFDLQEASPYMLLVADVAKSKQLAVPAEAQVLCGIEKLGVLRSLIPAVTHVDQSARIQTVDSRHHSDYYRLLQRFKTVTGCPVLINTSFNVRGEPMVGSPEDAFRCFMGTQMDALAIGRCFLRKQDQRALLRRGYAEVFALD